MPDRPGAASCIRSISHGSHLRLPRECDLNHPGFYGVYKIPGRFTKLSRRQKAVNRGHARILPCGERAIAMLKTWKILAKLPCCLRRATTIVQATLVLHRIENNHYSG